MTAGTLDEKEREFHQAYYLAQIQRQANHETNRLAVSSFIIAGSLVGIGFIVGKDPVPVPTLSFILGAIIAVNALAVLYIRRSRYWVKIHQERAGWALEALSPALAAKQKQQKYESKQGSAFFKLLRSELVQIGFHLTIVASLLAVIAYMFWPW